MKLRLTLLVSLAIVAAAVASDSPTAESLDFFEQKIRPVLVQRCYECHQEKQKGGLRLDSRKRILQGGESGAAILPGKPEESLLIEAVHYGADSYQMPPKGKLPEEIIKDFEHWVRLGAPWPGDDPPASEDSEDGEYVITAEQRAFWSFQPVGKVMPPAVADSSWVRNEIDPFILARLEEQKLKPAGSAEKRMLLRRATFDLTGLPPTPEEVEVFLADDSSDAFAKVVDRLLDSPRYGEHWARHWLDGVRYVSDVGFYNFADLGWRYRDWVVRALNTDMPYDDFVVHQIAGDLLPSPAGEDVYPDGIIATGVLAMGNYDDQESDKEKLYAEVIDDQIDLVSRQFLGLTIACARCHDHKFDPIPTADYYSLGGIFMSSQVLETKSRIGAPRIRIMLQSTQHWERRKLHKERIKQAEEALKRGEQGKVEEAKLGELREVVARLKREMPPDKGQAIGIQEGGYANSRHKKIGDMPIYIRGNPYKLGEVVPRRLPRLFVGEDQAAIGEQTSQSGRLQLARWIASPENPLTARVMVNRLWQYHFGRGLVATPSNFGKRGEKPSHPRLLDYLAGRFMGSGWSMKSLHRLMMNSAAYQQSGRGDAATVEADPENRLLGRFAPRRLAAEEIYDALLAVSGKLQGKVGQGNGNRAVYTRIGHEYPSLVASLFDAPPTGTMAPERSVSTTAPQALYMMNDTSVLSASRAFAERLSGSGETDEARIKRAYEVAYARPATEREIHAGREFLRDLPKDRRWTYYQVLLCASEFIHLD